MTEMTDDELYSHLFDPAPPPKLSDDQAQVYDSLFPAERGVTDGLTVGQSADYLDLFADESVMGEPAVVEELERGTAPPGTHLVPFSAPATAVYTARPPVGPETLLGDGAAERPQDGRSPAPGTPDHPSGLPSWLYPEGDAP